MTITRTAIALAERGLAVFPCRGSNKRPCTPHGFHDAERDPAAVRALFTKYPGELIGLPTGPVNNFDALDVDPRHEGDAWETVHKHQIPITRVHETRSGGRHYLFRHHPGVRNSESKIAPGVDTRGEGGYIIAWYAHGCPVASDAPLAPWPAWLLEILLPKPTPAQTARKPVLITSNTQTRRMVQRCLDRVAQAPAGQRHFALRRASYAIGGLLGPEIGKSEAAKALMDAVRHAGGGDIDEENASRTVLSGLEKGSANPFAGRT